ncbi:MAG: type-F conjugative transfer system secretin TraK [Burkholderiaceae bacterium]|nr:type-F conjugative transfer system secretin TraK [Burkholderiaceae bacterium]
MNSKRIILPLGLLCWTVGVHAGQPRDVRDGDTMEAAIASDAPTRIRLVGQRIINVVGNIHSSSNCDGAGPAAAGAQPAGPLASPAVNPRGDVMLNCDLDKGEIYVRPAASLAAKPINLFVSSPRATYTLLLRPAQMAPETLVLRDRRLDAGELAPKSARQRAAGHVRALKDMLVAMAAGRESAGVQVERMDVARPLWQEADLRLIRQHQGNALVGDTYRLRNVGTAAMVLAEREFDRDGVMAVAIEQHNLRPGETTLVYVIRGGEDAP